MECDMTELRLHAKVVHSSLHTLRQEFAGLLHWTSYWIKCVWAASGITLCSCCFHWIHHPPNEQALSILVMRLATSHSCMSSPPCSLFVCSTRMLLLSQDIGWTSPELDLHKCLWWAKAIPPLSVPICNWASYWVGTAQDTWVDALKQFTVCAPPVSAQTQKHDYQVHAHRVNQTLKLATCEPYLH